MSFFVRCPYSGLHSTSFSIKIGFTSHPIALEDIVGPEERRCRIPRIFCDYSKSKYFEHIFLLYAFNILNSY